MDLMHLVWPLEAARSADKENNVWLHQDSNCVLDFHGDPLNAKITVLSDGNHHMALEEAMQVFLEKHPDAADVFYVTLPPNVILPILDAGFVQLGNLRLPVNGDIVISPEHVVTGLCERGVVTQAHPFVCNRGSVLLVSEDNPKQIQGVQDLLRDDVRLFISNPVTEKVSYQGYRDTLINAARHLQLDSRAMEERFTTQNPNVVYGEKIHHREAPLSLVRGGCDVAIVYYHLALRYTRIFPGRFTMILLGGTEDESQPWPGNAQNRLMVGALDNQNTYQKCMIDFLRSREVAGIYERHGLDAWA